MDIRNKKDLEYIMNIYADVSHNKYEKFYELNKLAKEKNGLATYFLSLCYRQGKCVKRDVKHAAMLLMEAVELRDTRAILYYLNEYYIAENCYYDEDFLTLMDYESDSAKLLRSIIYLIRSDFDLANEIAEYLDNKGNTDYCIAFGNYYRFNKNFEKAIYYFKKGADRGNKPCMMFLAILLNEKNEFHNEIEAYEYLRMFNSDGGNWESNCHLGEAYLKGKGTNVYIEKAFECFKKAYELGERDQSIINRLIILILLYHDLLNIDDYREEMMKYLNDLDFDIGDINPIIYTIVACLSKENYCKKYSNPSEIIKKLDEKINDDCSDKLLKI